MGRMTRARFARIALVPFLACSVLVPTPSAQASCAIFPDELSFRQMMRQGTTADGRYDRLFFGRVVDINDLEPGKGGDKMAKLAVAESPVGYAPLVARVRFWTPEPGVGVGDFFTYERRSFYVVVAHRRDDGTFEDDAPCGRTQKVGRDRFWGLVHFARTH